MLPGGSCAELRQPPPTKLIPTTTGFTSQKSYTQVLKSRRTGLEAQLKAFSRTGSGREEPTEDTGGLGVRADMTGNPHGGQSQKRTTHFTRTTPPRKELHSFVLNIKQLHCSFYVLIPITVQKRSYVLLQSDKRQRNNVEKGMQRSPP